MNLFERFDSLALCVRRDPQEAALPQLRRPYFACPGSLTVGQLQQARPVDNKG